MPRTRLFVFFATLLLAFALRAENMLPNSDFSLVDKTGFPTYWAKVTLGGAKSGKATGPDGKEIPVMEFDLKSLPTVTRIEQAPPLVPGRTYKVTFEAKCENLSGAGVYLTTMRWQGGASRSFKGTHGWKTYQFTASFPGPDTRYRLILYAAKGATGKAYFRKVTLEEVLPEASGAALVAVPTRQAAPVIDGKLDDALWQSVSVLTPFVQVGKSQYTHFAQDNTEARLATDGKFLYAAFLCHQQCLAPVRNQLDLFKCNVRKTDATVTDDDCVRLFIGPAGKDAPVYEYTVNALGTMEDAKCTGEDIWTGRDLTFSGGARCAGFVGDGFFSVELAVPLKLVGLTGQPGEKFSLMLGRINHARKEGTLFYPAPDAFHVRAALGEAIFSDMPLAITRWEMNLQNSARRRLSLASTGRGTVLLQATGEDRKAFRQTFALKPGANDFTYTLPGKEYNRVSFTVEADGRTVLQTPVYTIGNAMVSTIVHSQGKSSAFNAERGLYPAPEAPFGLQKNGYPARFDFDRKTTTLAVGQTLFWPEDNNNFHIAAGSLQPLHIIATNPESRLAELPYALHLVLPSGLELETVTAHEASPYKPVIAERKDLVIDGKPYRHYRVVSNVPQPCKAQPDPRDAFVFLIRAKVPYAKERPQLVAYAYAEWDNGRIVEVPQVLSVHLYPALVGKVPKLFRTEMWGGNMVNLGDKAANLAFLTDTFQRAGFNQLQNFPVKGMKRMGVLSYARILGKGAAKTAAAHPEYRRINSAGEKVPLSQANFLCTDILLTLPEIAAIGYAEIARQLKGYDVVCLDYESPARDGMLSCYCDRCLRRFAAFAKLPSVPARAEIHAKYNAQWCDFMSTRLAQSCAFWKALVNAQGKEFYFYSGYQSPKSLAMYSVDWRKLAPVLDLGGAGYTATQQEIRATAAALQDTPLLCGAIPEPWHLHLRQKSAQVPIARLAAGLVGGGKGILVYNLPGCDGRSYSAFTRFNAFLADYEVVLYHGRRATVGVPVKGLDPDRWALFTAPGSPRVLVCYNLTEKNAAVTLELPFAPAKEYFTGKTFPARSASITLPPGEMAAFIEQTP